jgi:ceramide glucosyltransferase
MRWARLRRHTFMPFFLPELLGGGISPLAACAIVAVANDWPVAGTLVAFAALWYGAELALAAAADWHRSWRSPAAWVIRDLLIPVLWVASWIGNEFEWRGNPMTIAQGGRAA